MKTALKKNTHTKISSRKLVEIPDMTSAINKMDYSQPTKLCWIILFSLIGKHISPKSLLLLYPTVYGFIGFIDYVLFIEKLKYFQQTIIIYSCSKIDEKLTLYESFNWNFNVVWFKNILYFLEVFN